MKQKWKRFCETIINSIEKKKVKGERRKAFLERCEGNKINLRRKEDYKVKKMRRKGAVSHGPQSREHQCPLIRQSFKLFIYTLAKWRLWIKQQNKICFK